MAKNIDGDVNNMTFDVFDDPIFFILIDLNSILCILFSFLAFYLILCKSPRIIGKYKWYLLNISICSFLYDIYITFIWKPMLFFPSPTMCSTGILRNFGWVLGGLIGYLLYPILWGISNMSIVWAFVYRWATLAEKLSSLNSWRGISAMFLIQIFYELPTTILYLLSALDRPKVLEATINHYPNLAPWVSENKPCAITSFEASQWAFPFIVSMNIQFFAGLPFSLFFLYLAQRQLKAQDRNMSTIVAKMHRDMLKALIMQLIVPFLVMFLPYTLGGILVMGEVNVPILYKMIFFVGSLHSVLNTLMMISFIPSYRRQIYKFIEYIPSNLKTTNLRIILQSATTNAKITTRT